MKGKGRNGSKGRKGGRGTAEVLKGRGGKKAKGVARGQKRKPRGKDVAEVGRFVALARARHARDLKEGHRRGLWFDEEAADRVVKFFGFLRHWKGEWARSTFRLAPWQEMDVMRPLFGWKVLPAGVTAADAVKMTREERVRAGIYRRYRKGYIEIPKKNGKTTLGGGIGLYLEMADGEPGAEVYSAATKRDQARLVFDSAVHMVRGSPALKARATVYKGSVVVEALNATFQPLSSDEDTLEGINPHGAIVDELHAHRTGAVWDLMQTSSGARRQSLVLAITTAGQRRLGPCWDERQYAEKVLLQMEGFRNDSYFGYIACADAGDDWRDPRVWRKANPNFGVSVYEKNLVDDYTKALGQPRFQSAFRRYHLNIWVEAAQAWMSVEKWRACGCDMDEEALRGRVCMAGLDLSRTVDLTALVLVFPPTALDSHYRVVSWFWVPEERIEERVRSDRVPYDTWVREGWLEATPGDVVDYSFVQERLRWAATEFDLRGIGFDPYNATKFYTDMQTEGFQNFVEVRQGARTLSAPMKELERLILQGLARHGRHPVMDWCMSNVVVKEDAQGNVIPDKLKSTERIDGVSALVTAMRLVVAGEGNTKRSVYEDRGPIFLGRG